MQKFPENLLPSTFFDADNAGNLQARNEVQRHEEYINILEARIGDIHPYLVELVKQCLHNAPEERLSTEELLTRLQRMREEVEGRYGGGVVKLDLAKMKLIKELEMKDRQLQEQQVRQLVM